MKKFSLILLLVFALSGVSASAAPVPVLDWGWAFDPLINSQSFGIFAEVSEQDGSIALATYFSGTPNFDPTGGVDEQTSAGGFDSAVTMFSSLGEYLETYSYGGASHNQSYALGYLEDGSIIAGGNFSGTVDFDPGLGTAYATSSAGSDAYLVKFSPSFDFEWVQTWGGAGNEQIPYVKTDGESVYAHTIFSGTVDFDPTENTSYATSSGSFDGYVSKFNVDGTFDWAMKIGGTGFEGSPFVDFIEDDLLIYGTFANTVDFDPSEGTTYATSSGSSDVYIARFQQDGSLVWLKTFGSTGGDGINNVIVSDDTVYLAGYFEGTVDFDPDIGSAEMTSGGGVDIYLLKLNYDGDFIDVETFGGTGDEYNASLVFCGENVCVVGSFGSLVDFDPGVGTNSKTPEGTANIFISQFTTSGEYLGTDVFGGDAATYANTVKYHDGKLVLVGTFDGEVDLDPSAETLSYTSSNTYGDTYIASYSLIEPDISVSSVTGSIREGQDGTASYSVVLTTYPTEDVVITVTPDAQVTVSPTTLTFSTTTWDIPQTVTISPVDDEDEEGIHSGTITHSVTTGDSDYDGFTVPSVTVSVLDNDRSVSSGSSRRTTTTTTTSQDESVEPAPAEPAPETPMTPEERAAKIEEIKSALITLITQLIAALQKQIAEMSA